MKRTKKNTALIILLSLILGSLTGFAKASSPNIVVILTDDLGFSDIGCYGSEIETPVLDNLASQGVRFTQFYNTAKCHSTRISLLTGRYPYQAGNKSLNQGYTIAEVLRKNGYFTAMTGKWHLEKEPTDFGFDRYFGHLSGATNFYLGDDTFRLNGQKFDVPQEGFYTTTAKVDYALQFLDEARETQKPWFLYIAFNAPHAPLQPLEEDYKKYLGRYDEGWDSVHEKRVEKQKKLGLFDGNPAIPERPGHIPSWDKLNKEISTWESRRMAAYAALVDRVDQELGRLVANIEEAGEMENTLILFLSDNGACAYDRANLGMHDEPYNPKSGWSDSTGWAWARNAPFRFYKQNQFEGGITTPAILHWPSGLKLKDGSTNSTPLHVIDILPTLAELTGSELPSQWPDRELTPVVGNSFSQILSGNPLPERDEIFFQFSTDRALRMGDWKLVSFKAGPWELYNIPNDRTELNDLSDKYSEKVDVMAKKWHDMAINEAQLPERLTEPVSKTKKPQLHHEWSIYSKDASFTGTRDPGNSPNN